MDRESVDRLHYDRRLHTRRGWVEDAEIASHLDNLPDVSDKMTTSAELEAEEAATSETAEAEVAPAAPAPPAFGSPSAQAGAPQTKTPQATIGGPIGGVAGEFSPRSGLGGGGFGQDRDGSKES